MSEGKQMYGILLLLYSITFGNYNKNSSLVHTMLIIKGNKLTAIITDFSWYIQ